MTVMVLPTAAAAASRAAEVIAQRLSLAVAEQGHASIALSGGSTPRLMFDALVDRNVPWESVDVFQVDERAVPEDDPERNWAAIQRQLLLPGRSPRHRWHAMDVIPADLESGAIAYAQQIRRTAASGFDVVHLGLGDDGHTASWPPEDPVITSVADVAIVGPYRGVKRMTLTPRVVNAAHSRIWLVSGADKRAALTRLLSRDDTLPASAVETGPDDVIVADAAAAPPAEALDRGGGC